MTAMDVLPQQFLINTEKTNKGSIKSILNKRTRDRRQGKASLFIPKRRPARVTQGSARGRINAINATNMETRPIIDDQTAIMSDSCLKNQKIGTSNFQKGSRKRKCENDLEGMRVKRIRMRDSGTMSERFDNIDGDTGGVSDETGSAEFEVEVKKDMRDSAELNKIEKMLLKIMFINTLYKTKVYKVICPYCSKSRREIEFLSQNSEYNRTYNNFRRLRYNDRFYINFGVTDALMKKSFDGIVSEIINTSVMIKDIESNDLTKSDSMGYLFKNIFAFLIFSPLKIKLQHGCIHLFSKTSKELKRRFNLSNSQESSVDVDEKDICGNDHLIKHMRSVEHRSNSDKTLSRLEERKNIFHVYVESKISWNGDESSDGKFHNSLDYIKYLFNLDIFKKDKPRAVLTNKTSSGDFNSNNNLVDSNKVIKGAPWLDKKVNGSNYRDGNKGSVSNTGRACEHYVQESDELYCDHGGDDFDYQNFHSQVGSLDGGKGHIKYKPPIGVRRMTDGEREEEELNRYKNPFNMMFQLDSIFKIPLKIILNENEDENHDGPTTGDEALKEGPGDEFSYQKCPKCHRSGLNKVDNVEAAKIDRIAFILKSLRKFVMVVDDSIESVDDVIWGLDGSQKCKGDSKILSLGDRCALIHKLFLHLIEKIKNDSVNVKKLDEIINVKLHSALYEVHACFNKYSTASELDLIEDLLQYYDHRSTLRVHYWQKVLNVLTTRHRNHFIYQTGTIYGQVENQSVLVDGSNHVPRNASTTG